MGCDLCRMRGRSGGPSGVEESFLGPRGGVEGEGRMWRASSPSSVAGLHESRQARVTCPARRRGGVSAPAPAALPCPLRARSYPSTGFFFLFFWHVPVVASSFKWPILAPRRFSFAPPRRLASSFQCPFLLLVGRFWPRPSRCLVTSTPLLAPRRPSLPRPSSCPVLSTPLHAPRCPSPPRPSRCIVPSTPSLAPLTPLCAGPSPFAPREGLTSVV